MSKSEVNTDTQNPLARENVSRSRRRMLEIIGTTAVALPVLGLSACGGDDSSSGAAATSNLAPKTEPTPMKEAEATMEAAAEEVSEAVETAAEDTTETAEDMMAEMKEEAKEETSAAADTIASDAMAKVDENGPQAAGLGYRHDASTVDASVQTRYKTGQQCSNCVLYQGGDAEWGGCPLFAGKAVKSTGWCNAYAAKA